MNVYDLASVQKNPTPVSRPVPKKRRDQPTGSMKNHHIDRLFARMDAQNTAEDDQGPGVAADVAFD